MFTWPNKLMKVSEYPDGSSHYRIACECLDSSHDVHLFFDKDEETSSFSLELIMSVDYQSRRSNVFVNFWHRLVDAVKLLFTGKIQVSGDVILEKDGIEAMQAALKEGMRSLNNKF